MNDFEKMLQVMKTLRAVIQDSGNYEARKIGLDKVNGLEVSTVHTSDYAYETAIIDTERVYPVERYSTLELAQEGHKKWMKEAEKMKELVVLEGLGGIVPPEVILNLKRSV